PEFDSPTVFAALLDDQKGGRFQIQPQLTSVKVRQLYLPDTNILVTRFLAEEGVAEIMDYMPIEAVAGHPNEIVRLVSVIRGNVRFEMHCQPRFDYAASGHRLELANDLATFFSDASHCPPMSLYSNVPMARRDQDITSVFTLSAGEKAVFLLSDSRPARKH